MASLSDAALGSTLCCISNCNTLFYHRSHKALLTKCQLFIVTCMGGPGQGPPFAATFWLMHNFAIWWVLLITESHWLKYDLNSWSTCCTLHLWSFKIVKLLPTAVNERLQHHDEGFLSRIYLLHMLETPPHYGVLAC